MAELPIEISDLVAEILDDARKGSEDITSLIKRSITDWAAASGMSASKIKILGTTVDVTSKITKDFGKGMLSLIQDLNNSNAEFTQLNGIVGIVGGAFSDLIGTIPVLGGIFSSMADAATQTLQFAMGQTQQAFGAFQDLGKVGIIGAEGLTGFVLEVEQSNIPLQRLQKMLEQGSESLAYIAGSAVDGGKLFTNVMNQMQQGISNEMRLLGFTLEEISETAENYMARQRKLGNLQEYDAIILAQRTREYGKELDLIAKLTGKSRENVQKEFDDQLRDARFRASLMELGKEEQLEYQKLITILQQTSPEMAQGFKDFLSGFITTDAARKLFTTGLGEESKALVNAIRRGAKVEEVLVPFMDRLKEISGTFPQQLAKIVGADSPFVNFAELAETAGRNFKELIETGIKLRDTQKTQTSDTTSSTYKLIETQKSLEKTISRMNTAFADSKIAIGVINGFGTALDKLTEKIYEIVGKEPISKEALAQRNREAKETFELQQSLKAAIQEGRRLQEVTNELNKGRDEMIILSSRDEMIKLSKEFTSIPPALKGEVDAYAEKRNDLLQELITLGNKLNRLDKEKLQLQKELNPEVLAQTTPKLKTVKYGPIEVPVKPPALVGQSAPVETPSVKKPVSLQVIKNKQEELDNEKITESITKLRAELVDLNALYRSRIIKREEYLQKSEELYKQQRALMSNMGTIKQPTEPAGRAVPKVEEKTEKTTITPTATPSSPMPVSTTPTATEVKENSMDRQTNKELLDQAKTQSLALQEISRQTGEMIKKLGDNNRALDNMARINSAKG